MDAIVNSLKDRISIVRMAKSTSTTGAPIDAENLVKSCRANTQDNTQTEDEDGKVRSLFTTIFTIRYDKNLIKGKANGFYIKDAYDNLYNIISVVEKIPKRYLQINTIRRE